MKSWKKWSLVLAVIVCISAASYMVVYPRRPRGVEVKVEPVRIGPISSYLSSSGTVQSRDRKDYFVLSPAGIDRIYVKVGDEVEKGELLVKLDVPDLTSQLKQAYIQLDIARMTLDSLKRQKEEGDDSASPSLPSMVLNQDGTGSMDDRIKLQEKQVELARVNVEAIREKMSSTQSEIKSGIKGVITAVNGSEGGAAGGGLPLVTVEDISRIKAVINASQYDAAKIKPGQEAVIRMGEGGKKYSGVVEKVNPVARKVAAGLNAETSVPVDISISNPDDDIKVGYDVDVNIRTDVRKSTLYVPYEAVMTDKNGKSRVYVVENGRALEKYIKTGIETDFYMEVLDGLSQGQQVVLNPPGTLLNGSPVYIRGEEK